MANTDARPPLSQREAIDTISRFLPLEWSHLTDDQVTVESITGGYLNTVNLVTRCTKSILEPDQVVIRRCDGGFQRQRGKGTPFSTKFEEMLVFNESSKLATAPKLYGMDDNLTVQEYFKGHTLTPDDCLDEKIRTKIAQAYAKFHSIDLPIDRIKGKETIDSVKEAYKKFPELKDDLKKQAIEAFPDMEWDQVFEMDFASEYEWLLDMMDKVGYRTVMNTGDNNYLNVLVADDGNRVALIDYEMAKYEPRGLDLGGHLYNRVMNWSDKNDKMSGYDILDKEHRLHFVTEYCKEVAKHGDHEPDDMDTVDHVMQETSLGILHYPLIRSARFLGYIEHLVKLDKSFISAANNMAKIYLKLKERVLQENPDWE